MNPLLNLLAQPIIAHRGASGSAPENTLCAFELAYQQGADAFELDVRLTADGVPVVIHDPTMERTTGGRGRVAEQTLAQLREADAGGRFSPDGGRSFPFRGAGLVVPTLAEVIDAFPAMPLLVDIKESRAQAAVRQILLEEGAAERCVVASDEEATLAVFHTGEFSRAASPREISRLYWGSVLRRRNLAVPSPAIESRYRVLSVPARYRGFRVPTARFIVAARERGCPVHVWTVNDPALAQRLWRDGVAGIVTNFPERMVRSRESGDSRLSAL
ncbi:MAG: glycerophosphodiester phosphodiesterase [Gemmatimonadales bacterium]